MKLTIIAPSWDQGWWGGGRVLAPPLVLPLLAGLTPKDVNVRLIDENVEEADVDAPTDLVAMTCMTASAPRAYALCDAFRERKIPVVIGGIHPTVMPDEAALHADAVIIGEAEPVWDEVLKDFGANRLKPRYGYDGHIALGGFPFPRRDLLMARRYLTINVVQTARGCPNDCSFCTVSAVAGRKYRFRPIDEVIEEIRMLSGWIGLVDDNITGNPRRAKKLFEALIPLKRRWIGQGDLNMAKDPELLSLAARSGCVAMFMGLESLSLENLRFIGKSPNIGKDMSKAIQTIHKAGIEIIGSFVFGLDGDYHDVFKRTVSFAKRHKLVASQFAVLTPFPGTRTWDQLESEGRIFDHDWSDYTMSNVVFNPANMKATDLSRGQRYAQRSFYSLPSIIRRSITLRGKVILKIIVNSSYRRVLSKNKKKGLTLGIPKE